MAAKNLDYEMVNINLESKPDWFGEMNPVGTVPCLELDGGRTLVESLIINDFLDEFYPELPLWPKCPYEKACGRLLVECANKVWANFRPFINRETGAEEKIAAGLAEFEKKLAKRQYFGGNEPTMVDYCVYPFLERLDNEAIRRDFKMNAYPDIAAYVERMQQRSEVKKCIVVPAERMAKFMCTHFVKGPSADVNYDDD